MQKRQITRTGGKVNYKIFRFRSAWFRYVLTQWIEYGLNSWFFFLRFVLVSDVKSFTSALHGTKEVSFISKYSNSFLIDGFHFQALLSVFVRWYDTMKFSRTLDNNIHRLITHRSIIERACIDKIVVTFVCSFDKKNCFTFEATFT